MIELNVISEKPSGRRKPSWLRVKLPIGEKYKNVRRLVDTHKLHTICQSGNCPNMGECWGAGTATFMILGNVCTRRCGFCAVQTGKPPEYDTEEPYRVAEAIKLMEVKHAVITSVNRDELPDKGAEIWYQTVRAIKELTPQTTIETLIPETRRDWSALERMISGGQELVSHNIETVQRLSKTVQPQGDYRRSLETIKFIKDYGKRTKSGLMVGMGETTEEVLEALQDLADQGCDVVTIGQYLQPTKAHLPVVEFVHPDTFELFRVEGLKMGFDVVESGPMVRSSYHAERHL